MMRHNLLCCVELAGLPGAAAMALGDVLSWRGGGGDTKMRNLSLKWLKATQLVDYSDGAGNAWGRRGEEEGARNGDVWGALLTRRPITP